MKKKIVFMILFLALFFTIPARADIAPPGKPPGASLAPGEEATQVRMVAETVTLTVQEETPANSLGQAQTEAVFTMRNLGETAETLEVRFPLSYYDYFTGDFRDYPEINDLQAFVNGLQVGTRRVELPNTFMGGEDFTPWAVFDVTFPPGEDVAIEIRYTTKAFGDEGRPHIVFRYILNTGAGWNSTIGSADIIVRLPYAANDHNVVLNWSLGFGETTPGAVFDGNEVRWHFDDFEPTLDHDITLVTIQPEAWNKVIRESENVTLNPNDGEAWGRLGLAYKNLLKLRRGMREDPGGLEAYQLSKNAYHTAVTLLPDDSVWHYGFADLLWTRVAWSWKNTLTEEEKRDTMLQAFRELDKSLALNPDDERAIVLADDIYHWMPEYVDRVDGGYIFLALTATPVVPTPTLEPTVTRAPPSPTTEPTKTRSPTDVPPPTATAPPTQADQPPTAETEETANSPLCGGALIMPLFAGVFWITKRKQK